LIRLSGDVSAYVEYDARYAATGQDGTVRMNGSDLECRRMGVLGASGRGTLTFTLPSRRGPVEAEIKADLVSRGLVSRGLYHLASFRLRVDGVTVYAEVDGFIRTLAQQSALPIPADRRGTDERSLPRPAEEPPGPVVE
jgi:hypothetical protein